MSEAYPLPPIRDEGRPFTDASAIVPVAVFDLDGTLVDTAPDLTASLNHCLALAGLRPIDPEILRPHAGKGVRPMLEFAWRDAGLALSPEEMDEHAICFLAYYEAHIADRSTVYPGAVAALDLLEDAGFRLAICTNKLEGLSRRLLAEIGLLPRFAAVCGSDTFARRKPDPVHLLGTIEQAGGTPRGSLMIGDAKADIDAAWASGVPSILVDFGYGSDIETRRRAGRIVGSFFEIDHALIAALSRNEVVRA